MIEVVVDNIYGAQLPINVFISDIYGNNKIYLGTIQNPVPPSVNFYLDYPSQFDTAPIFLVTLEDYNSCVISTTNLC